MTGVPTVAAMTPVVLMVPMTAMVLVPRMTLVPLVPLVAVVVVLPVGRAHVSAAGCVVARAGGVCVVAHVANYTP